MPAAAAPCGSCLAGCRWGGCRCASDVTWVTVQTSPSRVSTPRKSDVGTTRLQTTPDDTGRSSDRQLGKHRAHAVSERRHRQVFDGSDEAAVTDGSCHSLTN